MVAIIQSKSIEKKLCAAPSQKARDGSRVGIRKRFRRKPEPDNASKIGKLILKKAAAADLSIFIKRIRPTSFSLCFIYIITLFHRAFISSMFKVPEDTP